VRTLKNEAINAVINITYSLRQDVVMDKKEDEDGWGAHSADQFVGAKLLVFPGTVLRIHLNSLHLSTHSNRISSQYDNVRPGC